MVRVRWSPTHGQVTVQIEGREDEYVMYRPELRDLTPELRQAALESLAKLVSWAREDAWISLPITVGRDVNGGAGGGRST